MADYYPRRASNAYNGINILNYDYAKYLRSSISSYVGSSHVARSVLNLELISSPETKQTEKRETFSPPAFLPQQLPLLPAISRRYQKYRSLLSRKPSTASLHSVQFTSLPDDVILLILTYVASNTHYAPNFNSDVFFGSPSGKRSFTISFANDPLIPQRVRRPKENAATHQYERYVDRVLKNFVLSTYYSPSPARHLNSILYTSRRLYRLALPLLYQNVRFYLSYRFAQFVTAVRANNYLGLLVESLELCIDTLYFISLGKSSMVITEKEKNRIEHLMNDPNRYFDGTFNNVSWDDVPSSRFVLPDPIPARLPILIIQDEHSAVNTDITGLGSVELGYKPKVVLAGWREWKHRGDPLYGAQYPLPELSRRIHRHMSVGSIRTLVSSPNSSRLLALSKNSSDSGEKLKLKIRRVVSRFSWKKELKKATKTTKSHNLNRLLPENLDRSSWQCGIETHPVKCKLLTKYLTKDVPLGFMIHVLLVCINIKRFDVGGVMLASDYVINYDAIDDYGVLKAKEQENRPERRRRASMDESGPRTQTSYHARSHSVSELTSHPPTLENAYGVSIYSRFNSVLRKAEAEPSHEERSLEFYKDSFGYSGNCNYKQIQSQFYKDFWRTSPGGSRSKLTYTLSSQGVEPRSKSPSFEYRPLLGDHQGTRLCESVCSSEVPRLLELETEEKDKQRRSTLASRINIIEEIEEDDASSTKEKMYSEATKSPTIRYFQYLHEPSVVSGVNQLDHTLHLSDVRKINNWSIDQLSKISNTEIMKCLARLKNLEYIVLKGCTWISTKDVEEFINTSLAIKYGKLRIIDFSGSGMRRDLRWAIYGSVEEIRKSLKEKEVSNPVALIGRNYIRI